MAAEVRACRACPSIGPLRRRVPGSGVESPLVVFVGEAPGRLGADRTGIPFSGDRSGAFLRELMAEVGLSAERNAYVTNVVKCNPRDARGNNRKPSAPECDACRRFLWREIALLRPRVIVALGNLACRELLGVPIRACVGIPVRRDDRWILPLYHPSYAASYSYPRDRYRRQFLVLRRLLHPRHGCPSRPQDEDGDGDRGEERRHEHQGSQERQQLR